MTTHVLDEPISARYVRFVVKGWVGPNPSLRVEILVAEGVPSAAPYQAPPPEPVVVAAVVESEAVPEGVPVSTLPPFHQQVEFLKTQLGLSGAMKEVVMEAAKQLGVEPGDRPLPQIAADCYLSVGVAA